LRGVSASDAQHLGDALGIASIADMASDVSFERARAIRAAAGSPAFDPGPPPGWEAFFGQAPLGHFQNHPSGRFRLEFGPVYYRGRLDGSARVIVVGQDPATNEILAQRIFVGSSGQRVQRVLARLGVTRSYSMLNTFLFSVFGQFDAELRALSLESPILTYRNAHLDRLVAGNPIEAVVTFGSGAKHAVENWPGAGSLPVFHLTHPAAEDSLVIDSWNGNLPGLLSAVEPDDDGQPDATPYAAPLGAADMAPIPRFDLPFGIPDFHGVDGGHSTRDGDDKIVWNAP
ncbi:MAG: uracil-DNA glycosylase family protein, partial [Gemmatimonadota bacterium]